MSSSFISITNLNSPDLRVYHEYSENQLFHINEPDLGIFIAESPKVIDRALDAGYEPISLLLEKDQTEKEAEEIIERITSGFDVPVYVAESEVLTQITGFHLTRGVLCAMRRKELPSVADVCQKARRVAVLENVTNPTNLGAIVRSAAALSMDAVLFTHGCTDPLYRRAARVSMGTVFQVPWTFLPEGKEFESLKELGFKSVAMALRNDTKDISDDELRKADKLAIFLGAEGDGLLPETISACDYCVKIPMAHGVDSLNVAAASAVAFWELSK
ncbi:RNA methyltransferase [Butyrivibrio sp.]|uniref:TrmH family RNA methyltransferase n=1 Tax=Butyrivibrio sp. TaxID=28121 RepID=UPI0025C3E78C|nr:RNA methyltransferase [Butyrivibrio sp.]MBQ9306146.1 RNA methyltransferase [Butyrivibrio sp.]